MGPRQDARSRIASLVAAGDAGGALATIESVVDRVFCEPLNTAVLFADQALDEACQQIGAMALRDAGGAAPAQGSVSGEVFIASRLQRSGGHTALLADIAGRAGAPVTVLLTGVSGKTDVEAVLHLFAGVEGLRIEAAPERGHARRLAWLQQRLRQLQPATVWLFNHHQDSVAVAAVQPGEGYRLRYVHHGDHHLCLGVTLPWGDHFDPHPMGLHNCRHVVGLREAAYLPMTTPDPGGGHASTRTGPLLTCTAAGHNKLEQDYWPDYASVIVQVLRETTGSHLHIGALTRSYRARIRAELARHGIDPRRWEYVPYVPSVARALIERGVDFYISSFPIPGARTLIEVMSAGVPVAAHDHSGSRFLGAVDMLPPQSLLWSQPGELVDFLRLCDREELRRRGALARKHYEDFHSFEAFAEALRPGGRAQDPPPSPYVHRPDLLAQALRRAAQFTPGGLLRRWVVRTARRLRSARG